MNFAIALLLIYFSMVQKDFNSMIAGLVFVSCSLFVNYYVTFHPEHVFLFSALSEGTGICVDLGMLQFEPSKTATKLQAMCLALVVLQCVFYMAWHAEVVSVMGVAIDTVYSRTWNVYYLIICAILGKESGQIGAFFKHFRIRSVGSSLRQHHTASFR
jgi:hypothetical protein